MPELQKCIDERVGFPMFDEELDKIKEVFLSNLQSAAAADPSGKIASQAFLSIAKRKQKEAGGLSRSDKQKFQEIVQKWEAFEAMQKRQNEALREAKKAADSGDKFKKMEIALKNKVDQGTINKELDILQEGIMKVQKTMGEQKNGNDRVIQNITKENERLQDKTLVLRDRIDTIETNFETVQESLTKLRRGIMGNKFK